MRNCLGETSYYEPCPDMVLARDNGNLDSDILDGITAYNQKDYQKVSIQTGRR